MHGLVLWFCSRKMKMISSRGPNNWLVTYSNATIPLAEVCKTEQNVVVPIEYTTHMIGKYLCEDVQS